MSFRYKLKYITNFYLPSGLFVVVSWASFLIPPEIVAGRMAMLITLFLVLINIFLGTTSHMPNAEGVTAMSSYIIVCILFVFGALFAYAFLLWRLKPTVLFQVWKVERTMHNGHHCQHRNLCLQRCSTSSRAPVRVKVATISEEDEEEQQQQHESVAEKKAADINGHGAKRSQEEARAREERNYFPPRGEKSARQRCGFVKIASTDSTLLISNNILGPWLTTSVSSFSRLALPSSTFCIGENFPYTLF